MGVVTFNVVQQALIEDLLSDLFAFHPELETFALECEEPLFIKNLENVQGDERDVILFSVGYGPDAEGRVSMNFGPLNRAGGERRLNVAVSRARYEMIIFSTLRSDMIDLNRTSSIGVAGLKRFLEYAEKGTKRILNTSTNIRTSEEETSIEKIIADKLRSSGYTVHTDIGCSGYKIDIGIVDTQTPSNYQLGIICDGKNYRRTKTVRDREIVQNNVLKALGWNICRIWTMDWWEKPDEVMASIQAAIAQDMKAEKPVIVKKEQEKREKNVQETPMQLKSACVYTNFSFISVQNYNNTKIRPFLYAADDIFAKRNNPIILSQVQKIIENEAPISKTLLGKKIISEWGVNRVGPRIDAQLEIIFDTLHLYRIEHDGLIFCWKDEAQYRSYSEYRPDSDRDAADLPPEEIANAIQQILINSISLPLPDLAKACAQVFGFTHMGSNIEASMLRGIQEAVKRNYAKVENGRATIID